MSAMLGALENFLWLGSVLALGGFLVAAGARGVVLTGRWRLPPECLAHLFATALLVPPVLAAWLVLATWLPAAWLGELQFRLAHPGPHHDEHLLSALVAPLQPVPRALTLSLFAGGMLCAAWAGFGGARRIARVIGRLRVATPRAAAGSFEAVRASAARHGFELYVLGTREPFCFVWGLRRPAIVLSAGLVRLLAPAELRGVLAHEAAHRRRGDNAVKLLLAVAGSATLAWPLARRVARWHAEQVELICDELATLETSAPLDIAGALVKVGRHATALPLAGPAPFFSDQAGGLERRVRRLLTFVDVPPARSRAARLSRPSPRGMVRLGLVFAGSLAVVSAVAPLWVHGAAELLLQVLR